MENKRKHLRDFICSWQSLLRIVAIVLFAAIILLPVPTYLEDFLHFVSDLGWKGPFIFIIAYVIGNILFIPGSILTLGAGFVFGLPLGSLYVWIGASIGCTCAFLIGRNFFSYWSVWCSVHFQTILLLQNAISENQYKIIFLLRLSLLVPYNVLNYTLAWIPNIKLSSYFIASTIGMIPGVLLFVYVGSVARDIHDIVTGHDRSSKMQRTIFDVGFGVTLVTFVLISVIAGRAIRKELRKQKNVQEEGEEKPLLGDKM